MVRLGLTTTIAIEKGARPMGELEMILVDVMERVFMENADEKEALAIVADMYQLDMKEVSDFYQTVLGS
jgi:hypothetical protein